MSSLIENLLYQSEGTALDFKKEQYPFEKATDEQKSELLKDILAFSNSWRQGEAYIVIGVQEVTGGRHIPVGTEDHFDDSRLQQFINGKTNRKVTFAYEVHLFEGKKIGVIRIPKQERPIYAVKNYGKVKKEVVYYRLGSSTPPANPDDIARMGRDSVEIITHTKLNKNLDIAQKVSKRKLRDRAFIGLFIAALSVTIIGIGATTIFLNKASSSWLFILFAIVFIIDFRFIYYFDAINLFFRRPVEINESVYIGRGQLMEIYSNNYFILYTPTAKCIYPHCKGEVIVADAPYEVISQTGKKFIGVCLEDTKYHSYTVDNNLVLTKKNFNWSSPKKN